MEKGNKTAAEITQRTGSTKLVVMKMDASSQKSIREFAGEFRKKYRRLDVLINNAAGNRGILPKINSVDGIELTFATNVVGYYLLTQELLDVLKKSAPARIVNVASTYASDLDLDDLQFERRPFESFKAYAQSKACDRLLTWALAAARGRKRRDRQCHDAGIDHRDRLISQCRAGTGGAFISIFRRADERAGCRYSRLAGKRFRGRRPER